MPATASRPATAQTLDVDGSPVRIHVAGTGPAVLLLHGSGPGTTASGAWQAVASGLGGAQLVAPDQAGFGGTPLPPGTAPGRALWTEQAAGAMDALGIDRYAVVGHSMGGAVALSLAAARPRAVRAVVAIATLGAAMPLPEGLDRLWAARPTPEGAETVQRLIAAAGAPAPDPAAVAARLAAMRAHGGDAYAALFPPPRDRWVRDLALTPAELAAVRAPVLMVHGARDRIVPLRAALPLVEQLADARLHVLGSCGHSPHAERPDAVLPLLADFLETHA